MRNGFFYGFIILGVVCICCNRKTNIDTSVKPKSETVIPELPRFQKKLLPSDTLALNTDTLLYYQKSACFGFCPTYSYTIYQNGMIKYNGMMNIQPIGYRYKLITDSWWKEVLEQIQKANFFELEKVYPINPKMYIPDLPNTDIIIKEFGKRKSVTDNHDAPKALKDFEVFLEKKFQEFDFNSN